MMRKLGLILVSAVLPVVASAEQTLDFQQHDFSITLPEQWSVKSRAEGTTAAVGEVFLATTKRNKQMLTCESAAIPESIVPANERQASLLLQRWLPITIGSHEKQFGPVESGEPRYGVEAGIHFGEVRLVEQKKRRAKVAAYRIFPREKHMIVCLAHFAPDEDPGHDELFASIRPLASP